MKGHNRKPQYHFEKNLIFENSALVNDSSLVDKENLAERKNTVFLLFPLFFFHFILFPTFQFLTTLIPNSLCGGSNAMYGGGGGDDALAARLGLISPSLLIPTTSIISREMSPAPVREERLPSQPQWSQQETREFIAIRAELERDFTASKRNKTLWEVVSAKMRERGYRRSPEQCKCKWKNLVNRYKVPFSFPFSLFAFGV